MEKRKRRPRKDTQVSLDEHFLKPCAPVQGQANEALQKERNEVEELNNAKVVLEKHATKLSSELKGLAEKSVRVREAAVLRQLRVVLIQARM